MSTTNRIVPAAAAVVACAGVLLCSSNSRAATYLGVALQSGGEQRPLGAVVSAVIPDSPAAKAGLAAGDVVRAVDDDRIDGVSDLARAVARRDPGDEVLIRLLRGGAEKEVDAVLADAPQRARNPAANLGVRLKEFPATGELLITAVAADSPAKAAGLRVGDVLTELQGVRLTSYRRYTRLMQLLEIDDEITLKYKRNKMPREVRLQLHWR